jgi:hypothetical protein
MQQHHQQLNHAWPHNIKFKRDVHKIPKRLITRSGLIFGVGIGAKLSEVQNHRAEFHVSLDRQFKLKISSVMTYQGAKSPKQAELTYGRNQKGLGWHVLRAAASRAQIARKCSLR